MGRYRIVARLGAGGMGRVYLGRSASGRAVAVKVVRAELAEDARFRRRFAREVEAARRVTGFFTAAVVDAEPEGSPPWLATAYVPGVSLDEAVRAHGAWPLRSVLALGAGLAEALEAIHAARLIHRDLKPSNVLLAADGPRVIDFGISFAADASALTQTGMVIGTPGFMSPEQVTGKAVGPASDVFALGAVLTFAATGASPFGTGSAHAVNFRAVYEEPNLSGLSHGLAVLSRCLAKDSARRPTVTALLAEFSLALGDSDGRGAATHALTDTEWLPSEITQAYPALTAAFADEKCDRSQEQEPAKGNPPSPASLGEGSSPLTSLATDTHPAETARSDGPVLVPPAIAAPSRRTALRRQKVAVIGVIVMAVLAFSVWKLLDRNERSPRWEFATDGAVASTPAVSQGTVYVASGTDEDETKNNGNLYAVEAVTGRQRWVSHLGTDSVSTPAITGETVYVGSQDGYLHAVEADTGKEKWRFLTGDWAGLWVRSSPVVTDGTVYVGGGDNTLYAVDATTGTKQWTFKVGGDLGVDSSPVVADGNVYVSDGNYLYAVDATTGRKQWSYKASFKDDELSSPVVAEGTVYISSDSALYAVNAASGREKWYHFYASAADALSPPVVAGGTAYVGVAGSGGEDGGLLAIDIANGEERWTLDTDDAIYESPAITDGTVYLSGNRATLYAIDATTGKQEWHLSTGDGPYSRPVVAGGTLFVGSDKGKLYAVDTKAK